MSENKTISKIEEYISQLETEKFTGKVVFELQFNEGGVRQSTVERKEKLQER